MQVAVNPNYKKSYQGVAAAYWTSKAPARLGVCWPRCNNISVLVPAVVADVEHKEAVVFCVEQ